MAWEEFYADDKFFDNYLMHGSYRSKFKEENTMSNTIYYIKGPVKFAKLFEKNRDTGKYAPKGGQYTIDLGLDKKMLDLVQGWNRLYKGKVWKKTDKFYEPGDSKLTYITFKRKHEHLKNDGTIIDEWSGEPEMVDSEGNSWIGGLVGNGSVCTLKLMVTQMDSKTFVRLEGVRVDEHVEFEGEEREEPTEENLSDDVPF